ncbi:MAG: dTDP-4-dehydrorhamnose 3,5-epimerase [Xanthobacteraceae bacterium]
MKLDLYPLPLPGVKLIRSVRTADPRGFFAETYVKKDFAESGICSDFIQDNQSFSTSAGTVRGLHFQIPPFQQAKLIRVLRGKILDVVVDLRRSSASYGRHISVELSGESDEQLFVPAGFAHGFCTLVDTTEIFYKVDSVYSSAHDRGINWLDPTLGIPWPLEASKAILSDKDKTLPPMNTLPPYFE